MSVERAGPFILNESEPPSGALKKTKITSFDNSIFSPVLLIPLFLLIELSTAPFFIFHLPSFKIGFE